MNPCLEAALELAKRGWKVLPVSPSTKKAAFSHVMVGQDHLPGEDLPYGTCRRGTCGWKHASSDPTVIKAAWAECGVDSWVAVACEMSGLVVLDVDPRNGGSVPPGLPDTLMEGTQSGGTHLYFAAPDGFAPPGQLAEGVEIKYKHLVVCAPTPGYAWLNGHRPAPWPEGLVAERTASEDRFDRDRAWEGLEVGEQDTQLFRYACQLEQRGLTELEAFEVLDGVASRMKGGAWTQQMTRDKVRHVWQQFRKVDPADVATTWARVNGDAPPSEDEDGDEPVSYEDWPIMDAPAYLGILRDVVDLLSPGTESDDVAILAEFLVAFGNACGTRPFVELSGHNHPGRLFACLVGDTARARKSGGWSSVKTVMRYADEAWLNNQDLLPGSGQGLIYGVRDPSIRQGPRGAPVQDAGVTDKRKLIHDPEFAGRTMKLVHSDQGTLSAVMREAWDHGDLNNSVVGVPTRATGAHVSFMGHATIAELSRQLTFNDLQNGLANRFLFFLVRNSKLLPFGGQIDWDRAAELGRMVAHRLTSARKMGRLDYGLTGKELWADWYLDAQTRGGESGEEDAMTARMSIHAQRLQVIYAVLDQAEFIEANHVAASIAVVSYCEASARRILGAPSAQVTMLGRDAQKLLAFLGTVEEASSRDVLRRLRWSSAQLAVAASELKRYQMVEVKTSSTKTQFRLLGRVGRRA